MRIGSTSRSGDVASIAIEASELGYDGGGVANEVVIYVKLRVVFNMECRRGRP